MCSAGVAPRQMLLTDLSAQEWREVMSVNLDSAFHLFQAAVPGFVRRQRGAIVTVSSMWGITGGSCEAAYSASKAGIIGLTKAVARELAGRGICCNAIAPGLIETDMTEGLDKTALLSSIPLGRAGKPEDVAALALFLAGPGGDYITGEVIRVDGGMAI